MKKLNKFILYTLAGMLFITASCTKEYTDPSRADGELTFKSSQGLAAVTVGLQRLYTSGRTGILFNSITANGFVSNELRLLNSGNIPELQLTTGGSTIDGTNSILNQLWTTSNKTIYDADRIIAGAEQLGDKGFASGLIAYSTIFKALAIGNLGSIWNIVGNQN